MAHVMTVHAMVSISRLAAMTGATTRALRYYEEVGLFRPYRSATGVRLFTPEHCEFVAMIVRLRRCEVPLEDIRRLLTEANTSAERQARLQALLRDRALDLARKLEVVTATLAEAA